MSGKSGRRPADASAARRQQLWTAIRQMEGEFTVAEIVAATGSNRKAVGDYLACLVAAGQVSKVQAADRARSVADAARYRLVRDTGHHAPRLRRDGTPVSQGSGTENMWRTMQMLGEFSARDLAVHSTTDDVVVSDLTAKAYLTQLAKAGYLRIVRAADNLAGHRAVYRLVRRSGPRPPQIQRLKRVYDPNTGEVFGAEEELA